MIEDENGNPVVFSKSDMLEKKIIDNCFSKIESDDYENFMNALNMSDHYLRFLIQSISEVMAEELEKLEEKISKKQNTQFKKRGDSNPYDTNIARNLSRGPG